MNKIKIQYVSDLHLEFKNNKDGLIHLNNDADILIIAGDLNVGNNIFNYLIPLAKKKIVIFVYGNHEFYNNKPVNGLIKKGETISKYNKNLHILNKNFVIINDITFIGATGWIDESYYILNKALYNGYNDFYRIHNFTSMCKLWGDDDKEFILNTILTSKTKYNIIITHFLPIPKCISPKYKNHLYNPCFSNNWEWVFNYSDKIDYWIHGHSHEYLKKEIGDITFCRNPFGYPTERTNFKPEEFITID